MKLKDKVLTILPGSDELDPEVLDSTVENKALEKKEGKAGVIESAAVVKTQK